LRSENTILIRFGKGIGIMRKNLFWLSDEQWAQIGPYLPRDVRGVERAAAAPTVKKSNDRAPIEIRIAHVPRKAILGRYRSEDDMRSRSSNVRFTPESGL
jgi:hypothetical protein